MSHYPFAKVTGQTLNARDLDPGTDADDNGTNDDDWTALHVGNDANTAPTSSVIGLVMSSAFTAATAAVLTFDADNATTTKVDEADERRGTYNGAMGTYRCDRSTDCTVTIGTVDKKLGITAMSAGWVFTPDAGATSDVPDTEYLNYGFWLKQTTDSDGIVTYDEVETFFGSPITPSSGETLNTVTGSATYSGDAVGVYVRDIYTSGGGSVASATSGHFTADVALKATFGQLNNAQGTGTIAPNMLNTVTGTIDNFMLSGGEANDWSVALAGTRTSSENTFSGSANGGGTAGTFNGTFYGAVTEDNSGTAAVNESVYPSHTAGEFNANFSNGTVAGAFGADR